ncbi:MAG TPA: hypothetical protein VIX59_14005 [Candidatus Binataceae bacterium]
MTTATMAGKMGDKVGDKGDTRARVNRIAMTRTAAITLKIRAARAVRPTRLSTWSLSYMASSRSAN